jgi:NAD-dependent SIR2 family protein deacetylase
VQAVAALLRGRSVVCLTGAGMSTDSGIPDYRGPGSPPRKPMTFDEFCSGQAAQRRYWSRAFVGWQHMAGAAPNDGHRALARMQAAGVIGTLVTQNVDGLHGAAGSRPLIDLHGRISEVICLECRDVTPRQHVQTRLQALNPAYARSDTSGVEIAPDGDALVDDSERFALAGCGTCGGRLKPHVVFFGENVPKDRVAAVTALVDEADALLVVGSSLTVMSGFRFVRQAHRSGTPVVIVNRGATRGDDLADVRVDAGCSETMTALAEELVSRRPAASATSH